MATKALGNRVYYEPIVQRFKVEELKEEMCRLMFRLSDAELHEATSAAAAWSTFTVRFGPAPPDFHEREAGKMLGAKGGNKGRGKGSK